MVRLDRIEFVKLLVSVFAGIFGGNIARNYFGDQIAGLFVTVVVLVVCYGALDFVDRRYIHRETK
ncbi:hypothetical protein [Methanogenium organophilum]|uniref:Uncharacterized protein n=1 Tax=Methanogenium organophilum TaxID=2199 RepID=A0A9X9T857_METOG|nr:hypothetical protein [Methanogenium organophilum]WAI01375.1 hypothetical protein OU421_00425 [Methanogenium organophilum]